MHVAEIWRYPVKSMAGESLRESRILADGLPGDRAVQVRDPQGRIVTARSRPLLLAHRGTLDVDGMPLVDGRPWDSAEVARDVGRAAGEGARLVRSEPDERFDILPLLVATDGAIRAFGHDGRRLRPNLVIGGVEGLAERGWEGCLLRVGTAVLRIADLRERCIMTTVDPDTQERDVEVLRRIRREFGGRLALNVSVVGEGTVRVGDDAALEIV